MDLIWKILLGFWLLSLFIFGWVMHREPRSLKSGFSFLGFLVASGIVLLCIVFMYSDWIMAHRGFFYVIVILGAVVMLLLTMFPVLTALVFFVEGVRVIRREGFSAGNLLSLAFSVLLLLFIFVWPFVFTLQMPLWLMELCTIVTIIADYLLGIFLVFCFSAVLNLIHFGKRKKLDQIVVLGSGIFGEKVTPLLAGRIQKGMDLLESNPGSVLILSGGQGPGESIPEGEAMAAWAREHGADPQRLVIENQSRNTEENLFYSSRLFVRPDGRTAVVSTGYHVFRALLLARRQGIPCIGYGSRTKLYFSLNALLREYVGYLSMTWKTHLKLLLLLLLPFWVMFVVTIMTGAN